MNYLEERFSRGNMWNLSRKCPVWIRKQQHPKRYVHWQLFFRSSTPVEGSVKQARKWLVKYVEEDVLNLWLWRVQLLARLLRIAPCDYCSANYAQMPVQHTKHSAIGCSSCLELKMRGLQTPKLHGATKLLVLLAATIQDELQFSRNYRKSAHGSFYCPPSTPSKWDLITR